MKNIINTALALIVGLAWIPLFKMDWKMALCIFLVMWSNNIFQEKK